VVVEQASFAAAHDLDGLAAAVFGGTVGALRMDPLIERWNAEVGPILEDDEDAQLWRAIRVDWALCDADLDPDRPGETWAWKMVRGQVPECRPEPSFSRVAASITGIFEVWAGRPVWLRCPLSGRCLRVLDALAGLGPPGQSPSALWELRLLPVRGGVRICRPPLAYPLEAIEVLDAERARRHGGTSKIGLAQLRRARIQWSRGRKRIPFSQRL